MKTGIEPEMMKKRKGDPSIIDRNQTMSNLFNPPKKTHAVAVTGQSTAALMEQAIGSGDAFVEAGKKKNSTMAFVSDINYFISWLTIVKYFDQQALRETSDYHPLASLLFPIEPSMIYLFVSHHLIPGSMPKTVDELLCQRGSTTINDANGQQKTIKESWSAVIKKKKGIQKYSTVKRRLNSLQSVQNQMCPPGTPTLTSHPKIKDILKTSAKSYQRKCSAALTIEEIKAMLESCPNTTQGIMHQALLTFAFASGGRRSAEVANLLNEQIIKMPDNDSELGYYFEFRFTSKTVDQDPDAFALFGSDAKRFNRWIERLGDPTEGPVFRRFSRKGQLQEHAITPKIVDYIIREMASNINIDESRLKKITSHSIRASFITEAARQGVSIPDIMACSAHKDIASVYKYIRAMELKSNHAMHLLD
jgi:site-specific recombinase XerD